MKPLIKIGENMNYPKLCDCNHGEVPSPYPSFEGETIVCPKCNGATYVELLEAEVERLSALPAPHDEPMETSRDRIDEIGRMIEAGQFDIEEIHDLYAGILERDRLLGKLLARKCNAGHENNLPVYLWDCPTCTKELQEEIKALDKIFNAVMAWITSPTQQEALMHLDRIKRVFRPLWRKRCGYTD